MKKEYKDLLLSDLQEELYNQNELLEGMAKKIQEQGEKYYQLKRDYDILYGKKQVVLKDLGEPVTTMRKTIETMEDMANLDFELNIQQMKYEALKRSVEHIKITIEVLRTLISIEKEKMKI